MYGFIGRSHAWLAGGARLLALAQERGQQTAELDELRRVSDDASAAVQAAMAADQRLDALRDDLAELGGSEPTALLAQGRRPAIPLRHARGCDWCSRAAE